jgi:dipeptidyl aminopeptidase/acylaminoacyl peptidase
VTRTLAAVALLVGACSKPAKTTASLDGTILERTPCPTSRDAAAFVAEVDAFLRPEMEHAGLAEELAARPPSALFPPSDHDRLVAAAASGRCERVIYRVGTLKVVGFVLRPPSPLPHDVHLPVVIWLRGGNREAAKIAPFALVHMLDLADAGFVVVGTQYRGVDGGDGADEFGGADTADVRALVPLAKQIPGADVRRLFLVGGSRGAMEGLIAMREGLRVRAAAFRGGVYDLAQNLADRPDLEVNVYEQIIPRWRETRDEAILHRSPIRWVRETRTPMLLLHGRQDWRSKIAGTEAMAKALADAGIEHELITFERDEHQLAFHRREWIAAVVAWFRRYDVR